jgi:ATP-dependent Lon protease
MITAIVSTLTSAPIRKDVAMTGEITLRGRVLPIGGLKEKILAARRGNIKTVIVPKENESDLRDIPADVLKSMEIVRVETADDVLAVALAEKPSAADDVPVIAPGEKPAAAEVAGAAMSGKPECAGANPATLP